MVETARGQSLLISLGSQLVFFTRPISEVFIALALISIGWGIWLQARYKAPEVAVKADYRKDPCVDVL
jgi:TctA family transporter